MEAEMNSLAKRMAEQMQPALDAFNRHSDYIKEIQEAATRAAEPLRMAAEEAKRVSDFLRVIDPLPSLAVKLASDLRIPTPLKDFAFTRLFSCGECGGGITATEKVKRLTDGTVKRYVYYHCTRHFGSCKESYLREEELLGQLLKLVECLDIDELGTIEIVKTELAKMQKLLTLVSKINTDPVTIENIKKIDVHACAKLVLQEGTKEEKRQLLDQLKSKIIVKNRKLMIEKVKKQKRV